MGAGNRNTLLSSAKGIWATLMISASYLPVHEHSVVFTFIFLCTHLWLLSFVRLLTLVIAGGFSNEHMAFEAT